jgi:hypothetical protein
VEDWVTFAMEAQPVSTIARALGASAECTPFMLIAHLRALRSLELHARCEARIHDEHLFLSVARLEARSLARLSYRALVDAAPADISGWIDQQIECAAVELITEDLLLPESCSGTEPSSELAHSLGIAPQHAHLACAQLNILPIELRRACQRLFCGADTLKNCAAEMGLSCKDLKEQIERVLTHIHRMTAHDAGVESA